MFSDGRDTNQVEIIGKISGIDPQSTHTQYTIDDRNAKINCKLWANSNEDIKESDDSTLRVGNLVKVIGKINDFRGIRTINIHSITKITDFNIVTQHGLEVILAHAMNTIISKQQQQPFQNQWDHIIREGTIQHNAAKQGFSQHANANNNVANHSANHSANYSVNFSANHSANRYSENSNNYQQHKLHNQQEQGGFQRGQSQQGGGGNVQIQLTPLQQCVVDVK